MGDVIIMQVIGIVRIELMRKLIVLKIIALNKVLVCSVDTFNTEEVYHVAGRYLKNIRQNRTIISRIEISLETRLTKIL